MTAPSTGRGWTLRRLRQDRPTTCVPLASQARGLSLSVSTAAPCCALLAPTATHGPDGTRGALRANTRCVPRGKRVSNFGSPTRNRERRYRIVSQDEREPYDLGQP